MTTTGMAENILTRARDDQETLTAWLAVMRQELRPAALKALGDKVQTEISRVRNDPSYRQSLVQAGQDIADAANDTSRIAVLESLILGKMTV
jgi:hypothetical protein